MSRREPKCKHFNESVGRISWPIGMPSVNEPHASTYVCVREACQRDATEWVESVTGVRGEFVPFPSTPAVPATSQLDLFSGGAA